MLTFSNKNFTHIHNVAIPSNIYNYRALKQINKFSTSAILFSHACSDYKDFNNEIKLTKEEELKLRVGLEEMSKNSEVSSTDVIEEKNKLDKYVEENPTILSSYDEAFPKLASENKGLSEVETKSIFDITKYIINEINNCISSGSIKEDCVNKLKLSELINKSMLKSDEITDKNSTELISEVVRTELENSGVLQRIGDITLRDIYEKYKILDDKISLRINSNYKEIGLNMVSYGILLNRYNKYVHNRPFPTNLTPEDLRLLKTTRTISRL